jgi:hypothetical protein
VLRRPAPAKQPVAAASRYGLTHTTCGSWSETWSAYSELMCTTR